MWLKRAMSADPIEGLAMDMEDLQRDTEDINDSREGGIYREHWASPRTRPLLARRISGERDFPPITSTGKNTATDTGTIKIL